MKLIEKSLTDAERDRLTSWLSPMRLLVILLYVLLVGLVGCATANDRTPSHLRFGDGPLPGDTSLYSFGTVQNREYYLKNVEHAQDYYGLFPAERLWSEIGPVRAPSSIGGLRVYYPLSVRWQLKDGRQFILEDIDIAAIMREYFKKNTILLQHQREGRQRTRGDGDPCLVHELQGDSLVIKWIVRLNHTPLDRRDKEMSKISEEEILVTTLKGNPTTGIDFSKRWEQRNFTK